MIGYTNKTFGYKIYPVQSKLAVLLSCNPRDRGADNVTSHLLLYTVYRSA